MDKLGTYIVKLLNENLQVYLPGLGTLKKERIPAEFDENTNTFLAPTHKIILDDEKGKTEPLIGAISKAEETSDEESGEHLKKLIGTLLFELNEKGKCTIPNLGEIIKEGDTLTFVEDKRKEDLPYYKNVDEIKLIESSIIEPVIEQETIGGVETENLPIQEFEPKGRPINWLWPVLIIIGLIAAGTFWFLNSRKIEQKEIGILGFDDRKKEVLPDTTLALNQEEADARHQDTTITLSLENTAVDTLRKIETTYEIIIVSFGKRSEAEKYVEDMNAKGYKIRILENKNPGNLYKVSYRSFKDEAEAQLELNNVRETIAKEAWIYTRKP